MTKVVVDSVLAARLSGLAEPVTVVDEAGRLLGHFVPLPASRPSDDCPYSPEELERMRREEGGRRLNEIWRSLGPG